VSGTIVTLAGVDEMQRELETIAQRSVPFAARETINSLAWAGRAAWQEEMARSLTLRNKFTQRRALVVPTRTLRMSAMEATLGHTEPYMALLEYGRPEKAAVHFRPIPTETAAGQAKGSLMGGRKKMVLRSAIITRLGALALKGAGSRSRKANNARAVRGALRSGRRIALLDMGKGGKGIYRVKGSKRKPEILKLYDLTQRATRMPRIPTLQRALASALTKAPAIAYAALEKQLARARSKGS
jgi:hypothetical protein